MKRVTKSGEHVAVGSLAGSDAAGAGALAAAFHSIPEKYPFRLNTYTVPPSYDITIEQFEECAYARLQRTPLCPPLSACSAAGH